MAKFIAKHLYNVFIYETYYELLIIVYLNIWLCTNVYIIDFGNTSKTYYSCLSLNCSPMINYILLQLTLNINQYYYYQYFYLLLVCPDFLKYQQDIQQTRLDVVVTIFKISMYKVVIFCSSFLIITKSNNSRGTNDIVWRKQTYS